MILERTSMMRRARTRSGRHARRLSAVALLVAVAGLASGCFDAPPIEDRWTRIDLLGSNLTPNQSLTPAVPDSITVSTDLIYRSIVTGYAVAELRASGTIANASVTLDPKAPRVPMAQSIDAILLSSVSVGRATRAVTGWDHLIQHIDFGFSAVPPASMDTTMAPSGTATGLFLLCYLGSGQRVERRGQSDTIIVTPYNSSQYQILPVGMKLTP
jgi:hypothetical protein